MLKKNKKNLLLAGGLLGALITSSAAGIALSSCTTTSTSRPTDSETEYTTKINWDDPSTYSGLTKDDQGLYYSDSSKTNVIALSPTSTATTITLPTTVKTISGYVKVTGRTNSTETQTGAFQDNTKIITITTSSSSRLTTIDKLAFSGCTSLESISDTNNLIKIGRSAFEGCTKLKSFNLSKVQTLGASAFKNCTVFDGAVDLNNVSSVSASSFYATSITSVDTSKNGYLTSIGNNAFENCTKLTTVTLPSQNISNLTTIGASAFSGDILLTTVAPTNQSGFYATSSITSIGGTAFKETIIESIDFSATSITNSDYSLDTTFTYMHKVTSVKLPNTLINIGKTMFNYCGDTGSGFNLELPSSIVNFRVESKSAGSGAMTNAPFAHSGLVSIDMSKITSYDVSTGKANDINHGQFWNATKLETVILKPGTSSLSAQLFQNCTSLKVVREPSQTSVTSGYVATSAITSVGYQAFDNAFAADSGVTVDLTATKLTQVPSAFSDTSNISSIKLPSTISTVGVNTFFGNTKLTNLTFGANAITSNSILFTASGITTANTSKTQTPTEYKSANLPFGSNSTLTALYYDNFASVGTSSTTSAQTLFETTSQDTWNAVAKIMNSLSNYDYSANDVPDGSASSSDNLPANLGAWTAETTTSKTSKILDDTTVQVTTATSGKLSKIVFDKCFSSSNNNGIGNITIQSTDSANSFIHNGVTWTYKNDGNNITLTGVANMYKSTVTSNSTSSSFLTFFNTQEAHFTSASNQTTTYIIPSENKVSVTLTIATKTAA